MTEKDQFTFHDDRYAAVGDLVVRAAGQAQAELEAVGRELIASAVSGHATMKALEERKARVESDAAALGAMAAQIDPAYAAYARRNGTRPVRPSDNGGEPARPAETSTSAGSDGPARREIRHYSAETKATFEERVSRYVRVMVSHGATVEGRDGATPNRVIYEDMGMPKGTWGNFSVRLRQLGLLTYEKDPLTKEILSASMDPERLARFIETGDLPGELAEELKKLDDYVEPEEEPEIDDPDTDDFGDEDGGRRRPRAKIALDKKARDTLGEIHTRYTGAARHRRAKQR